MKAESNSKLHRRINYVMACNLRFGTGLGKLVQFLSPSSVIARAGINRGSNALNTSTIKLDHLRLIGTDRARYQFA